MQRSVTYEAWIVTFPGHSTANRPVEDLAVMTGTATATTPNVGNTSKHAFAHSVPFHRQDNTAANVTLAVQGHNFSLWRAEVASAISVHDFYVSVGAGSQTAVLVHNCPGTSQGQPFDENQQAVVQLAKDAARSGISEEDFSTLSDWADEYGLSSRGPEIHPDGDGWASENWHGHIGPINHIPITMQP